MSQKEKDRLEAYNELREILKPGDTVYTTLEHVSRSGMQRVIRVFVFHDNQPYNLTYKVAKLLDYKEDPKHDYGLKVGGCGMDMGFSVVYNLSSALYRESGYECLELKGLRCPSNFHVNTRDKTKTEPIHHDGYALRHRWL